MSRDFMDQLNETPATYGALLIYVTMAYLTRSFGMDVDYNAIIRFGAATGILVQDGDSWRLLSHAFLHGGLIHLGFNSWSLLVLGPIVERTIGTWRFIVLYVVSAVSGCLLALAVNPHFGTLVGGSGALFGMLGAILALNVRGGRTTLDFLENRGSRRLLGMIALYLLLGYFIPLVSNSGHIGGLVGGFVLVYCFFDTGRRGIVDRLGRAIQAGWIALFAALILYQLHPVLRYDYQVKQYLLETDPGRKADLARVVDQIAYDEPRVALQEESEPRTGSLGVACLESFYRQLQVPEFSRALQGWKERSIK